MKPVLDKIDGEKYKWNPVTGEKYWLGYQTHESSFMSTGVSMYGIYFGRKDGEYVFFDKSQNELREYRSKTNDAATWWSDGDDDPSIPAVTARFHGVVGDGIQKDYIIGKIQEAEREEKIRI